MTDLRTPTRARATTARRPGAGLFRAFWRWHFYASSSSSRCCWRWPPPG
jgi:hypothetical protein